MHQYTFRSVSCLLFIHLCSIGSANAVDFFKTGFENGKPPTSTPIGSNAPSPWLLPPSFDDVYGSGNHFLVTDVSSHSGTHSLRIDYNGRNGLCNLCARLYTTTHKAGLDGSKFFVADTGEDLTRLDNVTPGDNAGPGSGVGKLIYNITNGFSKWEITSVETDTNPNDKLAVKLLKPGINGETPEFNGGDKIRTARMCGVDGNIGANDTIINRNDCNAVITWFGKTSLTGSQAAGQSIFRRAYYKAEISSPNIHQKLHYWKAGGKDIILLGESVNTLNGNMQPQLSGLGPFGGVSFYKPVLNLPADLQFERGKWYYVEEEFKAETAAGAGDGEYRLWFAESSVASANPTALPIINEKTLTLPPFEWTSFWGNIQHKIHTIGIWYMDDVQISSDVRIGPIINPVGTNVLTPNPATP